MKIALYRAAEGNWLDGAIDLFSGRGGFSHAELVFDDGVSFSSTSRGDDGCCRYADGRPKRDGTRWKRIDYDANPQRWLLVDIDVSADDERLLRTFCNGELDARYDFWGCARFVCPFLRQHPDDWFCSEIVVAALRGIGWWPHVVPHRNSPNHLARLLGVL